MSESLSIQERFKAIEESSDSDLADQVGLFYSSFCVNTADYLEFYMMGLVKYLYDKRAAVPADSFEYFKKAVEANDAYPMSRLYLAHCYHDLKKYDEALSHYSLVDSDRLLSEMPP